MANGAGLEGLAATLAAARDADAPRPYEIEGVEVAPDGVSLFFTCRQSPLDVAPVRVRLTFTRLKSLAGQLITQEAALEETALKKLAGDELAERLRKGRGG